MKSLLLKTILICGMSLGAATYSYAGFPPGSEIRVIAFDASGLVDTEVTVPDDECAKALAALIHDGMYIVNNPIGVSSFSTQLTAALIQKSDIFPFIGYSLGGNSPPRHAFLACGFFNFVGEETNCTNGENDDNDSFTDCADPDCADDPDCSLRF